MSDKPRLIWHSNSPTTSTGYGQQTALFTPYLKEHYNLTISAFYGLEGGVIPWNGIPVLPGLGQTLGNDTILPHANATLGGPRGGMVVTLMDVWPLDTRIWQQLNVASWVPVDHQPCPRSVSDFFHDTGAVPIAMSKFGQDELRDAGLDPLYCPHGVDTEVYQPIEQEVARKGTGMPEDAFIVGMVAANKGTPSRKCFSESIQAFKRLYEKHPEARLYLHTEMSGMFDGENLPTMISNIGLTLDAVIFPDQYRVVHYPFKPETMAAIYSSFDVLLMPSAGEGFGCPAIEAQACGVPIIVSDFSAQPELCGSGWKVKGVKRYTPLQAWQFTPDIDDIHDALRQAYAQSKPSKTMMSEKAREFALQYDVRRIVKEHLLPSLKTAQDRFEARKPMKVAA